MKLYRLKTKLLLSNVFQFLGNDFSSNPQEYEMDKGVHEILLIDDDAEDAELTIFALQKNHLANPIVHIDDGEKAMDFLFGTEERPGLILLDLKMPRVDGIQILRRLKGDPERKDIPVIAMLSSKEGRKYLESFQVKADAYVIKPVDQKQFFEAVAEMGIRSVIVRNHQSDS